MPIQAPLKTRDPEVARLLFRKMLTIHEEQKLDIRQRVEVLYALMSRVFVEVTGEEKLQFTTLFARIAYASHRFNLPKQTQFYLHSFRRRARQRATKEEQLQVTYQIGLKGLAESIGNLYQVRIPKALQTLLPKDGFYQSSPVEIVSYRSKIRVLALEDDAKNQQLIVREESQPTQDIRVQYNIAERNENFNSGIKAIRSVFGFPLVMNLIEVEIDKAGIYRPNGFVIEPDYLIDVSAISESFKASGTEPILYLLKKYLPFQYSAPLMLGNVANFFLDELMNDADTTYQELARQLFQLNPMAFATFEDRELREILQKAQKHYVHLKRMVQRGFPENNVTPEDCFLEPTFYSDIYGIQGRLDVFCHNAEKGNKAAIVELKSGKAYKPNIYGISSNHFMQTLLYDLIIKSAFQKSLNTTNYILYSGVEEKHLRFAPVVKAKQMEALRLRNELLAIEQGLINLGTEDLNEFNILDTISPSQMPHRRNGQAALWLNNEEEKKDNYEILGHLQIIDNQSRADNPVIVFKRSKKTSELANFRQGDIAVLYPWKAEAENPLQNQLFKCTIIAISKKEVSVRLRSRQFNHNLFQQIPFWNLEHDLLDSGFVAMYRNLFRFAQMNPRQKALMLGKEAPRKPAPKNQVRTDASTNALTDEQQKIFEKILVAEDYFLLWGPPGTGKTSMMLRYIVEWLLQNTSENLMLLAYTNRAVDEICESLERISADIKEHYLRIGSRYSTAPAFQSQLLKVKMDQIASRKSLKELIDSKRIFVSTVASISNRPELLKLKKFHRVIIDEASQILEPMLVGLLPQFDRCLLIGDHQQLPAVVVQHPDLSEVKEKDLRSLGLNDLRDSLFERLFRRCIEQNWTWAFDRLSQQGRMHQEIMDFPNQHFYQGGLKILPAHCDPQKKQTQKLQLTIPAQSVPIDHQLCQHRLLFFPTHSDLQSTTNKTNIHEAQLICQLVKRYQAIYKSSEEDFHANSIGVITPYRAQIAQIRKSLEDDGLDPEHLTIDTVERYQGGARDIIIISLCTNQLSQLASLVSESGEGVDRRLNVALTRARKQLIVMGNPEVLSGNAVYAAFMQRYQRGETF